MSTSILTLLIVGGVLCLYLGAEMLILFTSKLALSLGMTLLSAGLTVIALCTSLPEFVSSLIAQLNGGHSNMALGNVIGSNIANIGLILGFLALIKPVHLERHIRNFEAPLGIVLVTILWLMMLKGPLSRGVGILLIIGLGLYMTRHALLAKKEKKAQAISKEEFSLGQKGLYLLLVLLGTLITVLGGYLFIKGAIELAHRFQVSDRIIGLTVVAVGSSLPEFAASFVALVRKMPNLALGNIFGSNILNILFVLGVVSLISPLEFSSQFLTQDMPFMLALSILVWLLSFFTRQLNRKAGFLLLLGYAFYLYVLF